MSDTNANIVSRFSDKESTSHYTSIVYTLSPEEVVKNGGITCIGGYCKCRNKSKCSCLQNIKMPA